MFAALFVSANINIVCAQHVTDSTTDTIKDSVRDVHIMHNLSEITIVGLTGSAKVKDVPSSVSLMTKEQLQTVASTNVVDAIAKLPGLSQLTTGTGISKPIIRGLGYNRVVVVKDGVRQEGQQWGDEHGIEIDGNSVGNVEVLKGPASLRYGSDAMAGVIIFHENDLTPYNMLQGSLTGEYQTNSGLFGYSANFGGSRNGWLWDLRWSQKTAHAYHNANDGYVPGTQFGERALSAMAGRNGDWGHTRLRLSYYKLDPAIAEGERDSATGLLMVAGSIPTDDELTSYDRMLPFQKIEHLKAVSENLFYVAGGKLHATLGMQQNRRGEYEESVNEPGLSMRLSTVNYDVHYDLPVLRQWKTIVGMGGMYQNNANLGDEYLIPDYNLFDLGLFATASRQLQRWNVSGGMRFDTRQLHSLQLADRFHEFSKPFSGVSGSIGTVYHPNDRWNLRLNLARGFRAPNISELASNGHHEGTLRYEKGNADLKAEHSWQIDVGADYYSKYVELQVALFANRINNYIYLQRLAGVVMDDVDVFQYVGGDARLIGGEVTAEIHPLPRLHWSNTFSYVDARQLHAAEEHEYLPMTPMPRITSSLHYHIIEHGKHLSNFYVTAGVDCYLDQNHYLAAYGTETATPGYLLLNASIGTDIVAKGRTVAKLCIVADNLLDVAYQNHLSRLKYADYNYVTHRNGVFAPGRNVSFKLIIPLQAEMK